MLAQLLWPGPESYFVKYSIAVLPGLHDPLPTATLL